MEVVFQCSLLHGSSILVFFTLWRWYFCVLYIIKVAFQHRIKKVFYQQQHCLLLYMFSSDLSQPAKSCQRWQFCHRLYKRQQTHLCLSQIRQLGHISAATGIIPSLFCDFGVIYFMDLVFQCSLINGGSILEFFT